MYSSRNTDYLAKLNKVSKKVFRSSELALLWGITNKTTLHTTLYRYQKRKLLYRLASGIYSITSIDKLHPYEIGCAIAGSLSYISFETVLAKHGVINQMDQKITIAAKKSKVFVVCNQIYVCKYLNPKTLSNTTDILEQDNYRIASLERAVIDTKKVNPTKHFDGINLINKNNLKKIQRLV